MDFRHEQALKASQLAALLRLTPATVRRWMRTGHQGVKLESQATPGGRVTSWEAWLRFSAALDRVQAPDPPRSPVERQRAGKAAARELEGW